MHRVNVLQFICPVGMYGAERWILALANGLRGGPVRFEIALTHESSTHQAVIDEFQKSGQPVTVIEMRSRFSPKVIRDLCRLVEEHEIDIIHTHGYKSDILGLIAAKLSGIKVVSTPHGFGEPNSFKLKLYILLGKLSLWFFDSVCPLSRQLEAEVIRARVPKKKIMFIRNAVDLDEIERYRTNAAAQRSGGKLRIGFIGQLIPRKKLDQMLEIFDRLWQRHPDIELDIVGDGESRHALELQAARLPASESIRFLGFREDRLQILSSFDLFVMTSSDEGIPRCLMEAIAMGVPVAAYDIAGIDQLIRHGETGLLAPYGDREALCRHWEKLLTDRPYARALAERGRDDIARRYSGKKMAERYTGLYRDLAGKREG